MIFELSYLNHEEHQEHKELETIVMFSLWP